MVRRGLGLSRDTRRTMPRADNELRALADAAYGALNSGDVDAFLALVTEDVEFTSMVAEG